MKNVLEPRYCLWCYGDMAGKSARALFCSDKCRREYQNEKRREERAEAREIRQNSRPMDDPWEKVGVIGWPEDDMWGNALLDPLPAGMDKAEEKKPKRKKKDAWKERWLRLF